MNPLVINGIIPCMKSLVRLLRRALLISFFCTTLHAQEISIQALVTPSTVITKDGRPVNFALHGFIEFRSLSELFPYIDSQTHRWPGNPAFDDAKRQQLARELLRRGIESRVVSMTDERPFETLITHTEDELRRALVQVTEPIPVGYAEAFVAVQQKWKHAINCWSAAPSIPARVLSNWYPIAEGIPLYGATYDSTEHFWQAIKYHSDTTVADLNALLTTFERQNWTRWLARLDANPSLYLPNAYAIEFLRSNLTRDRLRWFRDQLATHNLQSTDHARAVQQRIAAPFRFTAFEEKVIWGDLADVFHLVYTFSLPDDPLRATLERSHFDGIYLCSRKMPFTSEDFRSLMLEIWHVKYLQMPRFRELISSIPIEIRLEHFLNDGDSPDIPIPIYVGYLNQIRDLARRHSPMWRGETPNGLLLDNGTAAATTRATRGRAPAGR
ncbi:MAG TPA: hypothetical protein VH350_16385 [Candidatus Sulfotelmatobacter sp.]|nr:hypothetical protein [Candidatus Sulfotelmatobacter sp.]